MSSDPSQAAPHGPPTWVLLAEISVDKQDRVQCQCKGCGQPIYARIHMIGWADGGIQCWGSDCYHRELGQTAAGRSMQPLYPGVNGRQLTPAEREMLLANREKLIAHFKAEQEAIVAERARAEAQRQDKAAEAEAARKAAQARHEAWRKVKADRRAANNAVVDPAPADEERSVWDQEELTCEICGQKTTEWWCKKGNMCKCKACLRAHRA